MSCVVLGWQALGDVEAWDRMMNRVGPNTAAAYSGLATDKGFETIHEGPESEAGSHGKR